MKKLLLEGGVGGHLMHLHDNRNLTFNKIGKILSMASNGELSGTEKTDGYNIYLGVKSEAGAWAPAYARNKGDMQANGKTFADLAAREFKGGPQVRKVYLDAFDAYTAAIESLNPSERDRIFGPDGDIFYNTEIQGPGASNVVNYDANVVSIHRGGHKRYNADTNRLEVVDAEENEKILDRMLDRFEAATAEKDFSVQRTAVIKLQQLDSDHDLKICLEKIKRAGLSGQMTIEQFLEEKLNEVIERKFAYMNSETKQDIIDKILGKEGAKNLRLIYKGFPPEQKVLIRDTVNGGGKLISDAIFPIEDAIHDFAVEMLRGLESAYILDNTKELKRLRSEVQDAIASIQAYEGPGKEEAQSVLSKQLRKIKKFDNISTAAEGFVFQHEGQMYKFTGNFAPVNQILGLFRYGRGSVPAISRDKGGEAQELSGTEAEKQVIAVVPGAFKPPHRGHLAMVSHYSEIAKEVRVLISPLSRKADNGLEFTFPQSKKVWEMYIQAEGLPNVRVYKSPQNSPVGASYDFIMNKENKAEYAQPGDQVILGASTKDDSKGVPDYMRFQDAPSKARSGVEVLDTEKYAFTPVEDVPLSARNFRNAVEQKNMTLIKQYLPDSVKSAGLESQFLDIYGLNQGESPMSSPEPIMELLYKMINDLYDEKEVLAEQKGADPKDLVRKAKLAQRKQDADENRAKLDVKRAKISKKLSDAEIDIADAEADAAKEKEKELGLEPDIQADVAPQDPKEAEREDAEKEVEDEKAAKAADEEAEEQREEDKVAAKEERGQEMEEFQAEMEQNAATERENMRSEMEAERAKREQEKRDQSDENTQSAAGEEQQLASIGLSELSAAGGGGLAGHNDVSVAKRKKNKKKRKYNPWKDEKDKIVNKVMEKLVSCN